MNRWHRAPMLGTSGWACRARASTRVWLSPLSVWEALRLIERKRVIVDGPADRWLRDALERAPAEEAPVTREVAFNSRSLQTRHKDPVDRFLVATAQVFGLTLVTADVQLMRLKGVAILKG